MAGLNYFQLKVLDRDLAGANCFQFVPCLVRINFCIDSPKPDELFVICNGNGFFVDINNCKWSKPISNGRIFVDGNIITNVYEIV